MLKICDDDEQIYLQKIYNYHDIDEGCCDFGIHGKLGFGLSGRYSIRSGESFLSSKYQEIDFHPTSRPTKAQQLIEFAKANNWGPDVLAQALAMTLARTTDVRIAEESIVSTLDKDTKNPENVEPEPQK